MENVAIEGGSGGKLGNLSSLKFSIVRYKFKRVQTEKSVLNYLICPLILLLSKGEINNFHLV